MPTTLRATLAVLLLATPLIACDDGPAERAGERIDRAAENLRDTVDPPRGPVERAGRAIDRAVD
jgi:predicted small secreted protein